MRLIILVTFVLGLCATPWVSAIVYQDLELESIVIDDDPDEALELEAAEETTTELPGDSQVCTSNNGASGTCMKFEECFPYLSYSDSPDFDSFQLYDIAKEASGPCPGQGNLICCPNFQYGLPIKKAQYEGQTTEIPINSTAGGRRRNNRNDCGNSAYQDSKVVGGRDANPGEFPYTVALLNKGKQFCGGSLISERWVLTAAHCIVNFRSFNGISIHAGDHDLRKTTEAQHQARSITKGFYNKRFSMSNLQHDVALLQLDRPVTLSTTVSIVCLSNSAPPENQKATLSGWGKTGKHQPPSPVLRTVNMRIIPHLECKRLYANEAGAPPVTMGMVCAGEGSQGSPDLRDACNGDSGGPLVIYDQSKATQIGVVSWGKGCGDKPGVYTRVDQYRDWIDKNSRRS